MLVVLVLLGLVIGGHGGTVGSPRWAAAAAHVGVAAAAQRSMDRVRGSGLPPRVRPLPDGLPFCFAKISEFWTLV